jgi:hypothetical protein
LISSFVPFLLRFYQKNNLSKGLLMNLDNRKSSNCTDAIPVRSRAHQEALNNAAYASNEKAELPDSDLNDVTLGSPAILPTNAQQAREDH